VPTYVTDVATSHGLSSGVAANIPIAAYGVVLIVVMLLFPNGIQGGVRRLAGPLLPGNLTRLASPDRQKPAAEQAEGLASPDRRRPVGEHQEEGTK
jgi:branched-chain amino acid transport system permease protein